MNLSRALSFINMLWVSNYKPALAAHMYRADPGTNVQQLQSANSLLTKQTKS